MNIKPGWKSTEWWTTIITQILALVAVAHPGFNAAQWQPEASAVAVLAAAVATGVYSLGRSQVKSAASLAPPAAPAPYHSAFAPTTQATSPLGLWTTTPVSPPSPSAASAAPSPAVVMPPVADSGAAPTPSPKAPPAADPVLPPTQGA